MRASGIARGVIAGAAVVIAVIAATESPALMRRRSSAAPSDTPSTPYARAEAAAAEGDCATALPLLAEALEQAPDDADALALRGYCLRKGGRIDDAFASYQRALEIRPEFPAARQYLGEAHLQAVAREAEILRGYGESGREELRALLEALREVAADQARRPPPADDRAGAPESRW